MISVASFALLPVSREVVAGADVVGHVDGGRHEVVCVRGVLVVVVQAPGEAEALALDVSAPLQSGHKFIMFTYMYGLSMIKIKFCMLRIIGTGQQIWS